MNITQIFELSVPKELDQATVEERASNAMNFWNNQFKEQLQKMIFEQYQMIGRTNLSFDFIKGTLNGLCLINDWFNLQVGSVVNKNNNNVFKEKSWVQ